MLETIVRRKKIFKMSCNCRQGGVYTSAEADKHFVDEPNLKSGGIL